MIEGNVIADDRSLADDHAHAVVNEEAFSDLRARMNLYAGDETGELRQGPRRQLPVSPPQAMRQPMQCNRMEARITNCYLIP